MKINVKVKEHSKEVVKINTDFIQLQSFLKFKGISETGGQAKEFIQDGIIRVNGEVLFKVRQVFTDRLIQNIDALLNGGELELNW